MKSGMKLLKPGEHLNRGNRHCMIKVSFSRPPGLCGMCCDLLLAVFEVLSAFDLYN